MIPTINTATIGVYAIRVGISLAVATLVFAFIPSVGLPDAIETAVQWLVQTMVNFDFLLPIATLFQVFQLYLLTEMILIVIKLILWLNHQFNKSA